MLALTSKVSVSLPDDDVAFLDEYCARAGSASRSAVVHQAIALLRTAALEEEYVEAFREWEGSEDARLWEATVADGLGDAPG
jgi:Arc/MetJ-type ribon-helix-helix transcriptional regulator